MMNPKTQTAPPDEMDQLYGDDQRAPEKPESIDEQEAQDMAHKAVVPINVLKGKSNAPLKEGDEVVVKVISVNGDEAQIAYSDTKPGEIGGAEETDLSPEDELDQLGKEY